MSIRTALFLFVGWTSSSSALSVARRSRSRRDVLDALVFAPVGAAALVASPCAAADVVEQQMKTSGDFSSYESVTGQSRGANLGAGSISGKSRPETGCVMVEAPAASGTVVSALLVLNDGVLATVQFDAPTLKLAKGFYYDVEARSKTGDSSYVQVLAKPGKKLDELSAAQIADRVLQPSGRYGAFGPPTDVKITRDVSAGAARLVDVSFSAITPGGSSTPRRAVVAATTAEGSGDVLLLVSSASEARWASGGEAAARAVSQSFRVAAAKATKLKYNAESDYRFEAQGGVRMPANPLDGFSTEPSFGSAGGLGKPFGS